MWFITAIAVNNSCENLIIKYTKHNNIPYSQSQDWTNSAHRVFCDWFVGPTYKPEISTTPTTAYIIGLRKSNPWTPIFSTKNSLTRFQSTASWLKRPQNRRSLPPPILVAPTRRANPAWLTVLLWCTILVSLSYDPIVFHRDNCVLLLRLRIVELYLQT